MNLTSQELSLEADALAKREQQQVMREHNIRGPMDEVRFWKATRRLRQSIERDWLVTRGTVAAEQCVDRWRNIKKLDELWPWLRRKQLSDADNRAIVDALLVVGAIDNWEETLARLQEVSKGTDDRFSFLRQVFDAIDDPNRRAKHHALVSFPKRVGKARLGGAHARTLDVTTLLGACRRKVIIQAMESTSSEENLSKYQKQRAQFEHLLDLHFGYPEEIPPEEDPNAALLRPQVGSPDAGPGSWPSVPETADAGPPSNDAGNDNGSKASKDNSAERGRRRGSAQLRGGSPAKLQPLRPHPKRKGSHLGGGSNRREDDRSNGGGGANDERSSASRTQRSMSVTISSSKNGIVAAGDNCVAHNDFQEREVGKDEQGSIAATASGGENAGVNDDESKADEDEEIFGYVFDKEGNMYPSREDTEAAIQSRVSPRKLARRFSVSEETQGSDDAISCLNKTHNGGEDESEEIGPGGGGEGRSRLSDGDSRGNQNDDTSDVVNDDEMESLAESVPVQYTRPREPQTNEWRRAFGVEPARLVAPSLAANSSGEHDDATNDSGEIDSVVDTSSLASVAPPVGFTDESAAARRDRAHLSGMERLHRAREAREQHREAMATKWGAHIDAYDRPSQYQVHWRDYSVMMTRYHIGRPSQSRLQGQRLESPEEFLQHYPDLEEASIDPSVFTPTPSSGPVLGPNAPRSRSRSRNRNRSRSRSRQRSQQSSSRGAPDASSVVTSTTLSGWMTAGAESLPDGGASVGGPPVPVPFPPTGDNSVGGGSGLDDDHMPPQIVAVGSRQPRSAQATGDSGDDFLSPTHRAMHASRYGTDPSHKTSPNTSPQPSQTSGFGVVSSGLQSPSTELGVPSPGTPVALQPLSPKTMLNKLGPLSDSTAGFSPDAPRLLLNTGLPVGVSAPQTAHVGVGGSTRRLGSLMHASSLPNGSQLSQRNPSRAAIPTIKREFSSPIRRLPRGKWADVGKT